MMVDPSGTLVHQLQTGNFWGSILLHGSVHAYPYAYYYTAWLTFPTTHLCSLSALLSRQLFECRQLNQSNDKILPFKVVLCSSY